MVIVTSFVTPDSPIHLEQRNVKLVVDKREIGVGTLIISERTFCWKNGDIGFAISYPNISLHAISSDANLYPEECIYIMIDKHIQIPGVNYENESTNDNDSDEDESEADISEIIAVPEDRTTIKSIYEALKECQELNPDPQDMDQDDEIFEDADEEFIEQGNQGGGGDNELENNLNDLNINSVNVNYDFSNGDHNNDEIFEDAD